MDFRNAQSKLLFGKTSAYLGNERRGDLVKSDSASLFEVQGQAPCAHSWGTGSAGQRESAPGTTTRPRDCLSALWQGQTNRLRLAHSLSLQTDAADLRDVTDHQRSVAGRILPSLDKAVGSAGSVSTEKDKAY